MIEKISIEIYEYQGYNTIWQSWETYKEFPYMNKCNDEISISPLDIALPSNDWEWCTSSWNIVKQSNRKISSSDEEGGWEYASRFNRFNIKDRLPKFEPRITSLYRRRLWTRIMKKEKYIDIPKLLNKIQTSLSSIHMTRKQIENVIVQHPDSINNEEMINIVMILKKNICDVLISLSQVNDISNSYTNKEHAQNNYHVIIKKLRNDVYKEEMAVDKAINSSKSKEFNDIRKTQSFNEGNNNNNINNNNIFTKPLRKAESNSFLNTSKIKQPYNNINNNLLINNNNNNVKSGKADNFNPSFIQSNNYLDNDNNNNNLSDKKKGFYVDRIKLDLEISKKFIAVDESTILQEIIDDRDIEIKKVHKGLVEINEMFIDLAKLVKAQELEIQQIFINVDESHCSTKKALEHITEANKLQRDGQCLLS